MSQSQLAETLTPTPSTITPSEFLVPQVPWGKLFPCIIRLKPVELLKDSLSFGRQMECDIRAIESEFPKRKINIISKQHFIVTKESDQLIIIRDVSRNGTWINKVPIGKGNKVILQDGDEISVGSENLRIYLFKNFYHKKDVYLPTELQKRYEVVKTLGCGGFGEVKLAFTKRGCQASAIKKVVKRIKSTENNNSNKVQNEVNILRSLTHPCIVMMREVIETDEAFFIVLEYMKGGTLQERIVDTVKKMSEAESKLIFYQISEAVKYLHDNDITHRDLKPDNVLLSSDDRQTVAKVSDFGLSKISDKDNLLLTTCGTSYFLAPEILVSSACKKPYTKKVDIWSCGVILYYMLSQRLPFWTNNSSDSYLLYRLIIKGQFTIQGKLWDDISEEAKDLIKKMLTLNPVERLDAKEVSGHSWLDEDEDMKLLVKRLISNSNLDLEDPPEQPSKRSRLSIDNDE